MVDYITERIGDNLVLNINCEHCAGTANFANPKCFSCVLDLLKLEDTDAISLNKDFKKIFSREQVAELKEIQKLISIAKKKFNYKTYKPACEICKARTATLEKIAQALGSDPVKAYYLAADEKKAKRPTSEKAPAKDVCEKCIAEYKKILDALDVFEKCELIKEAKNGENAYFKIFQPQISPSFISSHVNLFAPAGAKLLSQYKVKNADIKIFNLPGVAEKLYHISAPEFTIHESENKILNEALDRITREESRIVDPRKAREYFRSLGHEILLEHRAELTEDELLKLSDIIARYSAGYGILEIMLTDEKLQDVYIDSPGGSPIHVYHEDFEECVTNIIPTNFELEKLAARFRALSGRPFDESSPVLHAQLTDLGVRICGICPPATFKGIGFVFRRHRSVPWTLPQFIKAGMLDAETAGLLSFLVDGQRSILVTGPRGSGKSSLLSALLAEVLLNFRLIIIEDTPELPVEQLKKIGYKIEHIKTQPSLGSEIKEGYELTAEEALRTALRLGESVLIIGEVRGPEAKSLFEAMRIGAAGNVVMGTIHGSSAYDTWDRIVNDLSVPSTSFKATDIVVSVAAVRKSDEVRRYRRLIEITEIGKYWKEDPYREKGFNSLASYDRKNDRWTLENLEKSETIKTIAKAKGMKLDDAIANIKCRAAIKKLLVDYSEKHKLPQLLGIDVTTKAHNEYLRLIEAQLGEGKQINYKKIVNNFEEWLAGCVKSLK